MYYSYLAYNAYRYAHLLEYGYLTIHYLGKVYTWVVPKVPKVDETKDDWIICDDEDLDMFTIDETID